MSCLLCPFAAGVRCRIAASAHRVTPLLLVLQVRAVDVTNSREVSTTVTFSSDAAAGGPVMLPAL
jgi:hypothetical protein